MKKHLLLALLIAAAIAVPVGLSALLSSRISANEQQAKIAALLRAFQVPVPSQRSAMVETWKSSVKSESLGAFPYLRFTRGETSGYAFDITAKGSGGPIRGVLALSEDRRSLLGFAIYEQHEAPGAADEIAGSNWQAQFTDLPLFDRDLFRGATLVAGKKAVSLPGAVHGESPAAVELVRAINRTVARFHAGGRVVEELDLGLSVDAVTRATPGYPKHVVKPPNLREEIKRPPFLAPPGITNLAVGRPVTLSTTPVVGDGAQLVDNVKKSGEFDFVDLGKGLQWAQVDLGSTRTLFAVVVWHFYKNSIIYKSVVVQVSDDPTFQTNVSTILNNDFENLAGFGEGKDATYFARWWGEIADARGGEYQGTRGRYIRVYTAGGAGGEDTRFVEIAAYGK